MVRSLLILLVLAACARPLTEGERRFADTVYGAGLDAEAVRLHRGALIGNIVTARAARPARTCRERIRPPERGQVETSVAALVLFERIFYARRYWLPDLLEGYPEGLQLEDAMLLAHELTHVWQWQNRASTGYHPFRAAAEHGIGVDPYLFDLSGPARFSDYSYEQQGSLVEEFVCCRALDPTGARTDRLHDILREPFPTIARFSAVDPRNVRLFWNSAPPEGICS